MVRTAPDPTPYLRVASSAASRSFGMRGQPQIIVRRQIDDFLAVERADRRLLVLQHAQLEVRALGFEFVELVGEIGERVRAGCSSHENLVAADERAP